MLWVAGVSQLVFGKGKVICWKRETLVTASGRAFNQFLPTFGGCCELQGGTSGLGSPDEKSGR